MSELVVFNKTIADLAVYEEENKNLVFDYADEQGNKDARSHVYKLRKARSAFDKLRKETKAEALAACKNIDSQAKVIREKFDAMVDVHEAPIKRIEAEEEAKKQAFLDEQQAKREKVEADRIADLESKETELAELKAKQLAAENAIKAKEAAAKAEIERIAREKQIAEDAKKEAEEKAQRDLKAAEEKRVADIGKANRAARELAEAKEEAIRKSAAAAAAEKARLAKIEADRIADGKHRKEIELVISEYLTVLIGDEFAANKIVDELTKNKIPNITINY